VAPDSDTNLLGRLAVHYKLLTPEQVAAAAHQQQCLGGHPPLGQIFVERGWITAQQLTRLLTVQRDVLARSAGASAPTDGPSAPLPAPLPAPAIVSPPAPAIVSPPAPAPAPATPATPPPGTAPAIAHGGPDESVRRIDRLLRFGVDRGASDVHFHSGLPLRLRRHGLLEEPGGDPITPALIDALLGEVLDEGLRNELTLRGQTDFAHELPDIARFRGNAYRQQNGINAIFRVIPPRPPTLKELGLPPSLAKLTHFSQGLVLITGPGGCGKSSTLAALLRMANEERQEHIICIEDPIEYVHPPARCVVNQRQAGRDTAGFPRALRAALREDPDIIAIGELRDLETISLALTAAETGHLVLATLHTGSAVRTVDRVVGVFPPSQQPQVRAMLSESLRAVVSQRLVRRIDGQGRLAALEVLIATRAAANLIRENKTFQLRSMIQTGSTHGMCLLDQSLLTLVRSGQVAREEALMHCDDAKLFSA
jgi:twitching motility protein PilT